MVLEADGATTEQDDASGEPDDVGQQESADGASAEGGELPEAGGEQRPAAPAVPGVAGLRVKVEGFDASKYPQFSKFYDPKTGEFDVEAAHKFTAQKLTFQGQRLKQRDAELAELRAQAEQRAAAPPPVPSVPVAPRGPDPLHMGMQFQRGSPEHKAWLNGPFAAACEQDPPEAFFRANEPRLVEFLKPVMGKWGELAEKHDQRLTALESRVQLDDLMADNPAVEEFTPEQTERLQKLLRETKLSAEDAVKLVLADQTEADKAKLAEEEKKATARRRVAQRAGSGPGGTGKEKPSSAPEWKFDDPATREATLREIGVAG